MPWCSGTPLPIPIRLPSVLTIQPSDGSDSTSNSSSSKVRSPDIVEHRHGPALPNPRQHDERLVSLISPTTTTTTTKPSMELGGNGRHGRRGWRGRMGPTKSDAAGSRSSSAMPLCCGWIRCVSASLKGQTCHPPHHSTAEPTPTHKHHTTSHHTALHQHTHTHTPILHTYSMHVRSHTTYTYTCASVYTTSPCFAHWNRGLKSTASHRIASQWPFSCPAKSFHFERESVVGSFDSGRSRRKYEYMPTRLAYKSIYYASSSREPFRVFFQLVYKNVVFIW